MNERELILEMLMEILERQISSYDTMITHRKKAGMIDREQEKAMCAALLLAAAISGSRISMDMKWN